MAVRRVNEPETSDSPTGKCWSGSRWGCSLRFYVHNLGFWTELIDKVYNSERDRWQTYPEIASLEEQHMVDCINCNNRFSCFDRNWQRPSKIF